MYDFYLLESGRLHYSSVGKDLDLDKIIEQCCETIDRHHIEAVLSTRDGADVVHSRLSEIHLHIRGPSLLSTFLCSDKYYTRAVLDPFLSKFVYISSEISEFIDNRSATENVGLPAFVKPVIGTYAKLATKVNVYEDLTEVISQSAVTA